MVRGNWQKRVERTEARRVANKQRKQQRDNRFNNKALSQDLMGFLDRHGDPLKNRVGIEVLHIWTDSEPGDGSHDIYLVDDDFDSKRKTRSSSFGNSPEASSGGSKRRSRSSSFGNETAQSNSGVGSSPGVSKGSKKKLHPRSHQNSDSAGTETPTADELPLLCMKHFFTSSCPLTTSGRRKSSSVCSHIHYAPRHLTLANALSKNESLLNKSMDAVPEDCIDNGGVDMLYYLAFSLKKSEEEKDGGVDTMLASFLAEKKCSLGNIVYAAFGDVLLFDRYRNGVLLSDALFHSLLLGNHNAASSGERRSRSASVISADDNSFPRDPSEEFAFDRFPAQLLEYILTFLPDQATATMSRTCKAWSTEIGQSSPELWKHLLKRRKWPLPPMAETDDPVQVHRSSFTGHYGMVRNIKAIQKGLAVLMGTEKKMGDKEMVCQSFATRRGAPQYQNGCIAVRPWSRNRVLVAYEQDCTLRLFESTNTSRTGNSAPIRTCKEVVSVRVAPFAASKKRSYRLLAMDMDDGMIGCLGLLRDAKNDSGEVLLTVVTKDAFLSAGGGRAVNDSIGYSELESGAMQVFVIGEAIINYLMSADDWDHRLLRLQDFLLEENGDLSDLEVVVQNSLVACGHGFMVEVAISIPDLENAHDGDPVMELVARKLFLFSAEAQVILWMGDSSPGRSFMPSQADMSLLGVRTTHRVGGSQMDCTVALVPASSTSVGAIDIDQDSVPVVRILEGSSHRLDEFLVDDWVLADRKCRAAAISRSHIFAANNLKKVVGEDGECMKKSAIAIYSRPSQAETSGVAPWILLGDGHDILRLEIIHDTYLLVTCLVTRRTNAEGHLDGQWFGEEGDFKTTIEGLFFHVPTSVELDRFVFAEDESTEAFLENGLSNGVSIFFSSSNETMAAVLSWEGIVLTGADVRSVGLEQGLPNDDRKEKVEKSTKKKKKKQSFNKGKKDGFARGMSLRG